MKLFFAVAIATSCVVTTLASTLATPPAAQASDAAKIHWQAAEVTPGVYRSLAAIFPGQTTFVQTTLSCVEDPKHPMLLTLEGFAAGWGRQPRNFRGDNTASVATYQVPLTYRADNDQSTVTAEAQNNSIFVPLDAFFDRQTFANDFAALLTSPGVEIDVPFNHAVARDETVPVTLDFQAADLHAFLAACHAFHQ